MKKTQICSFGLQLHNGYHRVLPSPFVMAWKEKEDPCVSKQHTDWRILFLPYDYQAVPNSLFDISSTSTSVASRNFENLHPSNEEDELTALLRCAHVTWSCRSK